MDENGELWRLRVCITTCLGLCYAVSGTKLRVGTAGDGVPVQGGVMSRVYWFLYHMLGSDGAMCLEVTVSSVGERCLVSKSMRRIVTLSYVEEGSRVSG